MNKLLALLAIPLIANAEPPEEVYTLTDAGMIVLNKKHCPVESKSEYKYQAIATEWIDGQSIIHKGCWHKVGCKVAIWFYEENPEITIFRTIYDFKTRIKP